VVVVASEGSRWGRERGRGRGVAPEKAVHPKVDAFVATHQAVN